VDSLVQEIRAYEEAAQNTAKELQASLNENQSAQLAVRNAQAVCIVEIVSLMKPLFCC